MFTIRFIAFHLICKKWPNPSQNFFYSHYLNFHVPGSTKSVSKQPTQLTIELNSSLWQKLGTQALEELIQRLFCVNTFFNDIFFSMKTHFLIVRLTNIFTKIPISSLDVIGVTLVIKFLKDTFLLKFSSSNMAF